MVHADIQSRINRKKVELQAQLDAWLAAEGLSDDVCVSVSLTVRTNPAVQLTPQTKLSELLTKERFAEAGHSGPNTARLVNGLKHGLHTKGMEFDYSTVEDLASALSEDEVRMMVGVGPKQTGILKDMLALSGATLRPR